MMGKQWRLEIFDAAGRRVVEDLRQSWTGAPAKAVADELMGEFLAKAHIALRAGDGPPMRRYAGWWARVSLVDEDFPCEFADSRADDFLPPATAA
jgi:hypothetical protein